MNFNIEWTEKSYQNFINYLNTFADIKYKEFHSKLILTDNLIGIRMPILKKIAKELYKYDYQSFLKYNKCELYEEKIIYGLLICYINNYDEVIDYLNVFTVHIDNWAVCDLICSNLKIIKKNKDLWFNFIMSLIKSDNDWQIRFGLVLFLNYYIDEKYLSKIFKIIENIYSDNYYIKMAIAWLISICYFKYKDETYKFLKNNKLNVWTHNKAIQKIKESRKIKNDEKELLNCLKK